DEKRKFRIRNRCRVNPKTVNGNAMRRSFLPVEVVRTHREGSTLDPDHLVRIHQSRGNAFFHAHRSLLLASAESLALKTNPMRARHPRDCGLAASFGNPTRRLLQLNPD